MLLLHNLQIVQLLKGDAMLLHSVITMEYQGIHFCWSELKPAGVQSFIKLIFITSIIWIKKWLFLELMYLFNYIFSSYFEF